MFGPNAFDLAVNVEEAFELICKMSFCHQSQIMEWLPWVGRHNMAAPKSFAEWSETLRKRFQRKARELELESEQAVEVFTVTAWGAIPDYDQLLTDFPGLLPDASRLHSLRERLERWSKA